MIVLIISFIVFVCLCLGKYKQKTNVKSYAIASAFLLFIIIFLLIWLTIFLGIASNKVDDVICSIFKLPSGVIDGF